MMMWQGINLQWAYTDLLYSIQRKITCKQIALDILHDSLLRFALAKNPNRDEQAHAFLQVIVRNQLIDDFNYQKRYVSFDDDKSFNMDNASEHPIHSNQHFLDQNYAPSVEHLADIKQRLMAMQVLIDNLPPRCREAFWLNKIEGLDQSQIAERMGITRNIVQRHMSRAMVMLLDAQDFIL